MKGFIKRITSLGLIVFVGICVFGFSKNQENKQLVRDVYLQKQNIDYQSFFEEFKDAELFYSAEEKYISFSGIRSIDSSILDELDLVSMINDSSEELDIKYSFEYYEDTNLFYLTVIAVNVDGGEIIDRIVGVPFIDENGQVDIVFAVEDEIILLSELEDNPLFENCGWFSRALKKFAKAAAIIAVVAVVVVVVAAPALIAAIPTVSTVALAGGGTATVMTGGGAAAALTAASAAAVASLPTIAAATATTLVIAAVDSGIEAAKEEGNSNSSSDKKTVDDASVDHMFRDEEGHMKDDTPENREKMEDVANNPDNHLGTDQYGNDWYAKNNPDGSQIWVQARGNKIRNGGVNSTPRPWNPSTGLSGLNK